MQKPAIYIPRFVKHAVLILPLVVLAGCGSGPVLKSAPNAGNQQVIDYQLAKAQLTIRLRELGGEYAIEVDEPRYVGDPSASFTMTYSGSPFAEDDFTVQVDSKTRLLKKIQLKTTEKSDEVLTKAVESLTALESSPVVDVNSGQVLLEAVVNPQDVSEVKILQNRLIELSNNKVGCFVIERVVTASTTSKDGEKCTDSQAQTKNDQENTSATIDSPAEAAKVNGASSECSFSFCYRTFVPYKLTFKVGKNKFDKEIHLTKPGKPEGVSLDRTPFVEKVTNITFVDGAPNEVAFKKPSEALELVALPLTIAKAILKVPAELIQLKIDISDKERALAEKEKARIEAENNQKKARSASWESALLTDSNNNKRRVLMFGASGPWDKATQNGGIGISNQGSPSQIRSGSASGAGERETPQLTPVGRSRGTGR